MKLRHRSFLLALWAVPACCQSIPFPGPGAVAAAAWPNGYAHRSLFTFNVHPNSNLSAFPNLILGTYPKLADTGHSGYVNNAVTLNGHTVPADLIFTSDAAGSTLLSWEVEYWDNATGAIVAWVKSDRLAASDTLIYAWVGKASVTTYQCTATATWDSNFGGVWHRATIGSSVNLVDSTSNGNTTSGNATVATGIIDGADSGGYSYTNSNASDNPTTTGTFELWFYRVGGFTYNILMGNGPLSDGQGVVLYLAVSQLNSGVQDSAHYNGNSAGSAVSDSTWHHAAVTWDNSHIYTYLDGVRYGDRVYSPYSMTPATPLTFFWDYTQTQYRQFSGRLEEMRVSSIVRSADWIAHEFTQQSQASAWYEVGSWLP
jgi:hypothetical protein